MPLRERERVRVDPERLVSNHSGIGRPLGVDRLAPDEKRLLQAAAVIGKDVPLAVLRTIAAVAEDVLQHGFATLQAGEFLHEARLFRPRVQFKHALTHEVAYGTLLQDRRRALHARIVEAATRAVAVSTARPKLTGSG